LSVAASLGTTLAIMIFIPLPFVVALLLAIMLVRMARLNEADLRENISFMLLMGAYALQSVLIGIRWSSQCWRR
jgi:hypothetical protein